MKNGRIVGLIGLLLIILGVLAALSPSLAPVTKPSAGTEASFHVGGYVLVEVNGRRVYEGSMNSFHQNIVNILYAIISNNPTPTVTDINGTTWTINMTLNQPTADKFYLPLVSYSVYSGVQDVSYHGYPGAKLWVKSSTLNQNVTSGFTVTKPDNVYSNATHEWFWINVSFTASASSSGSLTLTYARLMHSKDGNPIYVPMLVDTISLTISSGDAVAINYFVYVKNPSDGGGSRALTLFVYEMLDPDKANYQTSSGAIYDLGSNNVLAAYLHYWSGSLPQCDFVVDKNNKPQISVTTLSFTYNRVTKTYVLNSETQYTGAFQALLDGKTITVKAIYTNVAGYTITGSALKVYGMKWYALVSLRRTVSVPSDKALLVQVTITFG
jgi:hypothetical protein